MRCAHLKMSSFFISRSTGFGSGCPFRFAPLGAAELGLFFAAELGRFFTFVRAVNGRSIRLKLKLSHFHEVFVFFVFAE